jgi:aspartyl-tRNA(Asn)/glutamyl-tRNA(Gln) amidotransferase subunit A
MNKGDILELSCLELREGVVAGLVSAVDAARACLDAISVRNGTVGAFISIFENQAMQRAESIDKRLREGHPPRALEGVPVAVKDNICTVIGETTCGSNILRGYQSPFNATVVESLCDAGAVILGKTNLDEFAMGSSTETSGFGPTLNPWDTARVPGGSSGGSAAAVAARMCFAALGSDTGGSIRQPASFCSVVGLKPTYGCVSRYGLVAYGSSLDQIGPITRRVEDCALLMNVIAGHDPADSTSIGDETAARKEYLEGIARAPEKLRIGVVPELACKAAPDVSGAIDRALGRYEELGAEIIEVKMPHLEYAIATYYVIAMAEASSNLARYDGIHYGYRSEAASNCTEVYSRSRAEAFGKEVKRRIMLGTYALSSGYYDAYYLKALKVRNLIRQDFTRVFERCDCIMMPVSPTTAFRIGEKTADPLQMYLSDIYTIAANLAGVPAVSVPCGFDSLDLPIGLQIISKPFSEAALLRVAGMYERTTDWNSRRPGIKEGGGDADGR